MPEETIIAISVGLIAQRTHPLSSPRIFRNLGWGLLIVGIGLAARSPWVVFTWPVAALFVHRSVRAEEVFLAREFGSAYETYRQEVPR